MTVLLQVHIWFPKPRHRQQFTCWVHMCDAIQNVLFPIDRREYMWVEILNIGKGVSRSIVYKVLPLNSNYYWMHDIIIYKLFMCNSENKHDDLTWRVTYIYYIKVQCPFVCVCVCVCCVFVCLYSTLVFDTTIWLQPNLARINIILVQEH